MPKWDSSVNLFCHVRDCDGEIIFDPYERDFTWEVECPVCGAKYDVDSEDRESGRVYFLFLQGDSHGL